MSSQKVSPTATPFNFTTDPSITSFKVPFQTYITQNPDPTHNYSFIATGSLVFTTGSTPTSPLKILLVQRSSTDSFPNLWEVPGGACDLEDATILHGVARELWEETGLIATKIGGMVGEGYGITSWRKEWWCKLSFLVEVDVGEGDGEGRPKVKLDENEHQDFVWASEEEVRGKRVGGLEIRFTTERQEEVILKAFEVMREKGRS